MPTRIVPPQQDHPHQTNSVEFCKFHTGEKPPTVHREPRVAVAEAATRASVSINTTIPPAPYPRIWTSKPRRRLPNGQWESRRTGSPDWRPPAVSAAAGPRQLLLRRMRPTEMAPWRSQAPTGRGRSGAERQRGGDAAGRGCGGARPQRGGDAAGRGCCWARMWLVAAAAGRSLSSPQLLPSLCSFAKREGRRE